MDSGLWYAFAGQLAAQGNNQPGTKWSDQQLKDMVDLARVGRKLTPKSWPNGARIAICLSFDDDTEAPLLRGGTTSPTTLSASDPQWPHTGRIAARTWFEVLLHNP